MNRILLAAAASVLFLGTAPRAARACPRDGTMAPCHCLERALSNLGLPLTPAPTDGGSSPVTATAASSAVLSTAVAQTDLVHVFNLDFSTNPQGMPIMDATIHVGDTVHWVWDAGFHSVTTVQGSIESFNSGDLAAPSAVFDHAFTHIGRITYYCDIHGFDNGNGTASGMAGVITVLAQPGDANNDGKVDFTDLLTLAQHYGQTTTDLTTGDFNGDGKIDFSDLLLLAQHYGLPDGAVATAADPAQAIAAADLAQLSPAMRDQVLSAFAQVPEPTALWACGLAALSLLKRRSGGR